MGTTGDHRHGQMSSDQAHPRRATTYAEAQDAYLCPSDARERYEELANRDVTARALATLQARGTYDPQRHSDPSEYPPLTTDEHLEILAAGEMLARHYRHPALVHQAVQAGASWPQIAAATGVDEATARQDYREWADGQYRLNSDLEGKFGLDAAGHAAALHRAAEPEPAARAETFGRRRLCAHADQNGQGMHLLEPGQVCSRLDGRPQHDAAISRATEPEAEAGS